MNTAGPIRPQSAMSPQDLPAAAALPDLDTPLYNSRIMRGYLEYIGRYHPHVDAGPILEAAGVTAAETEDPGVWFTQRQVDRFHDAIGAVTADLELSRKVGRFSIQSRTGGIIKRLVLGLITPMTVYQMVERLHPMFSRAVGIQARRLDGKRIEIVVQPLPGVREQPYQCANRIGYLEAAGKLTGGRYPDIDHSECLHHGGPCCRYVITIAHTASWRWRRWQRWVLCAGVLIAPAAPWAGAPAAASGAAVLLAAASGLTWMADRREKQELRSAIKSQSQAAANEIEAAQHRHDQARLVEEVSRQIARHRDPIRLLEAVVRVMERRFDFDRSAFYLRSEDGLRLEYAASHGFTADERVRMRRRGIDTSAPGLQTIIRTVLESQTPLVANGPDEMAAMLPPGTLETARRFGTRSLIIMPLAYETETLGALIVNSTSGQRRYRDSEVRMLSAVAAQTAAGLANGRAFQRLQESETRLRTVFQTIPDALVLFRVADHMIVDVNDGFTQLCGHPRQVVLGRSTADLGLWEDHAVSDRFLEAVLEDGQVNNFEARVRNAEGQVFPALLSAKIILLNRQAHLLVVGRDISDLRRAEANLARSEAQFRQVFDHAPHGMALVSTTGRFLKVNTSLTRILGYAGDELVGRHFNQVTAPEDHAIGTDKLRALLGPSPRSVQFEKRYRRKDGGHIWARVTTVLLRDTSGNPIFFIIHVDDITAERAAQAEREKMEGQLRQSAKLEAIATLAGGVAHDFNNLLMGIQGNVSLLRLDLPDSDPRYQRLENIETNVTNAKTLTRQLLGFARGGKYAARPLDLNPLVRETADLFARSRRQLQVEVDLAHGLWPVRADRDQLSEALMNLFVNAWQAMPGGGLLRVTTVNVTLAPNEAVAFNVIPGDYVRLAVADTGVGMDADILAKVFDPFFTTRIIGRGAGLGLAATYGIVRHHGGSIQAQSTPGQGTVFTIHLPTSALSSGPPPPPGRSSGPQSLCILLVDDEPTILEVGTEMLRHLGYAVQTAAGGRAALAAFGQAPGAIDLVILDMIMPEMSGAETFDRLRQIDPGVRVLLSSGYALEGQAEQIMQRGCNGFIQKPFGFRELAAKLDEIMDAGNGG